MVKFIVTGKHVTDQAHGMLGFPSFAFVGIAEITETTATGFNFDLVLPVFPGFPVPESVPDVYSGSGLAYKNITKNGITLKTPHQGTIDSIEETGSNWSTSTTGMGLSAADFYQVSVTKSNKDNAALVRDVFSGKDLLKGGQAKDNLNGFNGNDSVYGRGGNDILNGGNGNDKVFGGSGKDTIQGGNGRDILKGGAGADTFVFGDSGRDIIRDFQNNTDTVRLDASALGFNESIGFPKLLNKFGTVVNGDNALDFGDGNILIFDGLNNLNQLSNDLEIV